MMWPFNKGDTDIDQASKTLSPFITTALSRLEAEEIEEVGSIRTLAECYIYGAVRYLASYDDMRPANTGALLRSMLTRHFNADSSEVNQCLELCANVKDGEKEKFFMMEGAGALRRWLVNNDKSVASELKELMEMSNVSVTKVT
jgi:hypothetical protein